ncbi:MAG: AAA family ATPase [Dehalococcoidales bacterium]
MTHSIAVAGKGGTGKTSITSLVIRYLLKHDAGPILAVDADSNANLGESLGFEVTGTVGHVLDDFQKEKINIPAGITKEAYLEIKLNDAIVEGNGLDLLTMGRGEGPECYCYPNTMLRKLVDTLSDNYASVVVDNEAGMEHLSRRTTRNVDDLLLVSNHSVKGVRTLARLRELVSQLGLQVSRQWVLINAVPDGGMEPLVKEEIDRLGLDSVVVVPYDQELYQADLMLKPLLDMPDTSQAVVAIDGLMSKLPIKAKGGK